MSRLVLATLAFLALLSGAVRTQGIVVVDVNDKIRVRVGTPLVARGPAGDIADNWFTEIQLPDGRFRGFTAGGVTRAIDGNHPYEMSGLAATVLKAGPSGSPTACGQWIQHVELVGKTLYGWVHDETACNYAKGQTHASMLGLKICQLQGAAQQLQGTSEMVRRRREASFFDDRREGLIILDPVHRYSPVKRKIVSVSAHILTAPIGL
jgi:hypothetical protein